MKFRYRIEFILKKKQNVIFARQLDKYEFELGLSPTLNGCPIKQELSMPRKLKEDGSLDRDVFCFILENNRDSGKFVEGKIVELKP